MWPTIIFLGILITVTAWALAATVVVVERTNRAPHWMTIGAAIIVLTVAVWAII